MEHGTPLYGVMRCFGRIVFTVFAFLIAEGFAHTRNRARYFYYNTWLRHYQRNSLVLTQWL